MQTVNFIIYKFSAYGQSLMFLLIALGLLAGFFGACNLFGSSSFQERASKSVLYVINILFALGFLWICWFHYEIYNSLPIELPPDISVWLNYKLKSMSGQVAYSLPLYNVDNPPRYIIPLWIENEKFYFWFMCYAFMAIIGFLKINDHRFRGLLLVLLSIKIIILYFVSPFSDPLPNFFSELSPWFNLDVTSMERIGIFMKLYSKMNFYYNAMYMWFHPPMLFLSYASIGMTFVSSCLMLIKRDSEIEILGYDFAKFGYFMLTLGMLIGYPWALKAWGPNWWWDPKICSSIMMWCVYSAYLHTRLHISKSGMWYFTAILGIFCFLSMVFTLLSSYYFPGEHSL